MSKARRRRRLLQLNRSVMRRGFLGGGISAYREAWRRCWYDLNGQAWADVLHGRREGPYASRSPWVPHRAAIRRR